MPSVVPIVVKQCALWVNTSAIWLADDCVDMSHLPGIILRREIHGMVRPKEGGGGLTFVSGFRVECDTIVKCYKVNKSCGRANKTNKQKKVTAVYWSGTALYLALENFLPKFSIVAWQVIEQQMTREMSRESLNFNSNNHARSCVNLVHSCINVTKDQNV